MAGRTGRRRKQQSSRNPVTGMRNMQPVTGFLLARWYFVPTPSAGATIRLTGRTPSRGSQPAACQPEPWPGRRCRTASAPATPAGRQTEFGGDRLVDQRVVMLQGCAKPLLGERGPHGELQHAGGITGESGEVRSVGREVLLQLLGHVGVVVEQHGAVAGGEGVDLGSVA